MIEIKHLKTLQALRNSGSLAGAAAALHRFEAELDGLLRDLLRHLRQPVGEKLRGARVGGVAEACIQDGGVEPL